MNCKCFVTWMRREDPDGGEDSLVLEVTLGRLDPGFQPQPHWIF